MNVDWKQPDDVNRLREKLLKEGNAKQRDRYRVVLIAGEGLGNEADLHREQIAAAVGRSRQFVDQWVDQWVGRYRKGGIEALVPKRQPGARPKLTEEQQQQLCAMLDAGPEPEEGLSAYNGPILREKIQERFGKLYALAGVYALLHRLGYNDLMPRTTHPDTRIPGYPDTRIPGYPDTDPAELEHFKKTNCPGNWSPFESSIQTNES